MYNCFINSCFFLFVLWFPIQKIIVGTLSWRISSVFPLVILEFHSFSKTVVPHSWDTKYYWSMVSYVRDWIAGSKHQPDKLSFICVYSWFLSPHPLYYLFSTTLFRSVEPLNCHSSTKTTVNCIYKGSRLDVPYENIIINTVK